MSWVDRRIIIRLKKLPTNLVGNLSIIVEHVHDRDFLITKNWDRCGYTRVSNYRYRFEGVSVFATVFAVIVDGNVRLLLKVRVIIPINVPEIVKFQENFC